jgi:predicted nucleotidyltransferase
MEQFPETWIRNIQEWAERNGNVREVWLFGSRVKNSAAGEDSDVDLMLVLMPPRKKHDWAFGNYMVLKPKWNAELEAIVGRHVSLELKPSEDAPESQLLWSRDARSAQ